MSAGTLRPGVLSLEGLTRRFGAHTAVSGVSLEVGAGELVALVGAFGSGKTTTLRIVAGFERPDAGTVRLDGADITALPPQKRAFGMVFQHYALFPHMPVEDNVAFGLEARGVPRAERRPRALAALTTVGLERAAGRQVQSLSGGEQQRVALARALVIEPRVLLLDEPLSNLDPTLRRSMRNELRSMLHRMQVTALFVTHDQDDAFAVADRVALLRNGVLLQVGSPEELYARPASRDVAEFIGHATLAPASFADGVARVRVGEIEQRVEAWTAASDRSEMLAVLRPELLALTVPAADAWPGAITDRHFAGSVFSYQVRLDNGPTVNVAAADGSRAVEERVGVRIARGPIALVAAR